MKTLKLYKNDNEFGTCLEYAVERHVRSSCDPGAWNSRGVLEQVQTELCETQQILGRLLTVLSRNEMIISKTDLLAILHEFRSVKEEEN